MSASIGQAALRFAVEAQRCAICDRPIVVAHWSPLCSLHAQSYRHGPEFDRSPIGRQLREAMKDLLANAEPGAAHARLIHLLYREQLEADFETVHAYVERVRAEDRKVEARRASKSDERLEAEVQEEVIKELRKFRDRGELHYERINAGGHYNDQGQYVRAAATGIADILVWVAVEKARASGGKVRFGVGLALECKRPGGKQSEAQAKWEAKLTKAGGYYALVTSGDEASSAVRRAQRLEAPR